MTLLDIALTIVGGLLSIINALLWFWLKRQDSSIRAERQSRESEVAGLRTEVADVREKAEADARKIRENYLDRFERNFREHADLKTDFAKSLTGVKDEIIDAVHAVERMLSDNYVRREDCDRCKPRSPKRRNKG